MPAPIVLISNQRIKPGRLEAYKSNYAQAVERLTANRPDTLAHSAYLSADGAEVSVVMAFRDAAAMELHMRGLGATPQRAQESMEFVSVQIFGYPQPATLELIRGIVGPGVPVTIKPQVVAGYIRAS